MKAVLAIALVLLPIEVRGFICDSESCDFMFKEQLRIPFACIASDCSLQNGWSFQVELWPEFDPYDLLETEDSEIDSKVIE